MGRYAEYKDSGLEWLGEILADWNCMRMRFVTQSCQRKICL